MCDAKIDAIQNAPKYLLRKKKRFQRKRGGFWIRMIIVGRKSRDIVI